MGRIKRRGFLQGSIAAATAPKFARAQAKPDKLVQAKDPFRINQGGVKFDAIETRILRANNSAVAVGARAIARGGIGHDYWQRFAPDAQTIIAKTAAELRA
jgi:hypothetical protein